MFSWGLNTHGQLGLGNKFNCSIPTRIKELDPDGDPVVEISGGEHHSIASTKAGVVYCWGRNDEGQVGCGDTFGDYQRKKKADQAAAAEEKLKESEKEE